MLYNNNIDKKCMSCIRIYQIPGPTGATGIGIIGPTGPIGATGAVEPNSYNLYVQPIAPSGGDGSQEKPFQTIEEALAVVKPNGIINLLNGTKTISICTKISTLNKLIRLKSGLLFLTMQD